MIIPKRLLVGGHIYAVRFKELQDCGELDRKQNTIWIDPSLSQSNQEVAFFHELIHALNGELPEWLVDSLAEQLYAALDNNHLLKN